jgi:hypothetical protein
MTTNKNWKTMLVELEDKLAEVFIKKLPAIPENIKEMIVKYGPYLALIGIIFSVPALLALFGIGAVVAPWAIVGGSVYGIKTVLAIVFGLLIIVLEIMALPGLFKRQMKAWKIMFYISLISVVSNLISLNLFNLVIGAAVSWYLLFQIRSYYK